MRNHWLTENLSLWEVDDGEQHWYSAPSADRALEMHMEPLRNPKTGKVDDIDLEDVVVNQVSDDTVLPVRHEDYNNEIIRRTAKEWCADGEGFIASTVY